MKREKQRTIYKVINFKVGGEKEQWVEIKYCITFLTSWSKSLYIYTQTQVFTNWEDSDSLPHQTYMI